MTVAYRYCGNLYLNVTNRCPIACVFCIRHDNDFYLGKHNLRLSEEPTASAAVDEARRVLADGQPVGEIVFCGMGEPLMRPDLVAEVAGALREEAPVLRVDTCGLANLIHGRDVTAPLMGLVDAFSVSLNAQDAATYGQVCPGRYGPRAFHAVLGFALLVRRRFSRVTLSVVHPAAYARQNLACPVSVEKCQALADRLGFQLRVRGER